MLRCYFVEKNFNKYYFWSIKDTVKNLHTSQKNSFPRKPQNQEIHDTSSEELISSLPGESIFANKNIKIKQILIKVTIL